MKTSKTIKIHSVSPKKEGFPNRFYNLELENGDKINILKKDGLQEGQYVSYKLTGEDDGQQEFKKAKSVSQNKPFSGNNFDPDLSLLQTCVNCTVNLMKELSTVMPSEKDVATYAKNLFNELKK